MGLELLGIFLEVPVSELEKKSLLQLMTGKLSWKRSGKYAEGQ